ncbi:hypothetical protein YC2023_032041 [Brassica napus]
MIYNYCTDAKRFPQGLPRECLAANAGLDKLKSYHYENTLNGIPFISDKLNDYLKSKLNKSETLTLQKPHAWPRSSLQDP